MLQGNRPLLSRRLLDQTAQRQADDVFKVSGSEAGTAEQQLSDDAFEEDPSLSVSSSAAAQTARSCECRHGLAGKMDVNRNRGKQLEGISRSTMPDSSKSSPADNNNLVAINLSSALRNSAATLCSDIAWGQGDERSSSA